MIRTEPRNEDIYVSGLIYELWCFYVSVPNSELHSKICQSRAISTVEIFRAVFLCRLPVKTGYKHTQTHMQKGGTRTHPQACTFINHNCQRKWSHRGTSTRRRPCVCFFFKSHLSEFAFRWPVSTISGLCQLARNNMTPDCTSFLKYGCFSSRWIKVSSSLFTDSEQASHQKCQCLRHVQMFCWKQSRQRRATDLLLRNQ